MPGYPQNSDLNDFFGYKQDYKEMLSEELKLYLAQLVLERKDILFRKFGPGLNNRMRKAAWSEIRTSLMSRGAVIKDIESLRKNDWGNLRGQVLNRYSASKKTGAAGAPLSRLDQVVMEVIGFDSVNVTAVKIPENKVVFGNHTQSLYINGSSVPVEDVEFVVDTDEFAFSQGKIS